MNKPLFIPIDRVSQLPSGTPYVISYVEISATGIAVRFNGLEEGAGQEIGRTHIALRDDTGTSYSPLMTVRGGQVVPEEAIFGFAGPLHSAATRLEILLPDTNDVLERIELGR